MFYAYITSTYTYMIDYFFIHLIPLLELYTSYYMYVCVCVLQIIYYIIAWYLQ